MTQIDRDQTPAELAWVAERLEQERPTASPLELDRMKLQARTRAVRGARSQAKGSVLKSRVAITAILMLGLLTGGTGTTLALTGDASQVQYPREVQPQPQGQSQPQNRSQPQDRVLGTQQQSGERSGPEQVLGTSQSSPGSVQGSQQVAATQSDQGELPFTGLAAVPLIVLGLGLILLGTMLFRSARRDPSGA